MRRLGADQAPGRRGERGARRTAGRIVLQQPYLFDGYWKLPRRRRRRFRGEYCTVGDMAIRDADGFIQLVDRKSNMIISGGENVYRPRSRRPSDATPWCATWR